VETVVSATAIACDFKGYQGRQSWSKIDASLTTTANTRYRVYRAERDIVASGEEKGLEEQAKVTCGWMRPGRRKCGLSFFWSSLKRDKHLPMEGADVQMKKEERNTGKKDV
jgi:hypothetical protein